jgi:hypothetical protein
VSSVYTISSSYSFPFRTTALLIYFVLFFFGIYSFTDETSSLIHTTYILFIHPYPRILTFMSVCYILCFLNLVEIIFYLIKNKVFAVLPFGIHPKVLSLVHFFRVKIFRLLCFLLIYSFDGFTLR